MKLFKKIWYDPVWSKVIGAIIFAIISAIYNYIVSLFSNKTFLQEFVRFWSLSFSLWIYATFTFAVVLIIVLIRKRLNPIFGKQNPKSNIFFNIDKAQEHHFIATGLPHWVNGAQQGGTATGSIDFNNGILNITRTNIDGRYVVTINRYLTGATTSTYIQSDISRQGSRIFSVKFQAKIIGSPHTLWVVAKKHGVNQWVHNQNQSFIISSSQWRNYAVIFRIPPDQDFYIDFEDRDVSVKNSSIQIQTVVIEEILD